MPDQQSARAYRPRVLVTGFSVFQGMPVNPTEKLIPLIEAERDRLAPICDLRTDVYPVDYQGLPARLEAESAAGSPDIAIHFGVSAQAEGITIERLARNAFGVGRPDQLGYSPLNPKIHDTGEDMSSTLPFDAIHAALKAAGLPVSFSDDAGDYLCNYIFYLSRSKLCPGFEPAVSGFIHVPPLEDASSPNAMRLDDLLRGALIVIETTCEAWRTAQS